MCFRTIMGNPNSALAISRLNFDNSRWNDVIFCLDKSQSYLTFPVSMFIRRSSGTIDRINQCIQRLFEAGTIQLWMKRASNYSKLDPRKLEAIAVNMTHFQGVSFFLMIWQIIAVLTFILEHIVHYYCHAANVSPMSRTFWTFIEKVIDDKRHMFVVNEDALLKREKAAIMLANQKKNIRLRRRKNHGSNQLYLYNKLNVEHEIAFTPRNPRDK